MNDATPDRLVKGTYGSANGSCKRAFNLMQNCHSRSIYLGSYSENVFNIFLLKALPYNELAVSARSD